MTKASSTPSQRKPKKEERVLTRDDQMKLDDNYSVTIGRTTGKGKVLSVHTGISRQEIQLIRALLKAGMGISARIAGGFVVSVKEGK